MAVGERGNFAGVDFGVGDCLGKETSVCGGWLVLVCGTLVPVIGLVQVGEQALADRYTYLPLIGVFIITTWGVADLTQGWPARTAILKWGATVMLIGCLFLTAVQASYWENSIRLFTHDLAVARDNPVAHANIGDALDKQNKIREAKAEFMKALKLDPDSAHTLNGLGALYAHEGDFTNELIILTQHSGSDRFTATRIITSAIFLRATAIMPKRRSSMPCRCERNRIWRMPTTISEGCMRCLTSRTKLLNNSKSR